MNPTTEKCIRLFILDELHVGNEKFRESYHNVKIKNLADKQKDKKSQPLEPWTFDAQECLYEDFPEESVG